MYTDNSAAIQPPSVSRPPTTGSDSAAKFIACVFAVPCGAAQAKGRTGEAIGRLCQLAPPTALLLDCDAAGAVVQEREVPTSLLHRGDLLKVGGWAGGRAGGWVGGRVGGWMSGWVGGWLAGRQLLKGGNCWWKHVRCPRHATNAAHHAARCRCCRCCRGRGCPRTVLWRRGNRMWMSRCSPESQVCGRLALISSQPACLPACLPARLPSC